MKVLNHYQIQAYFGTQKIYMPKESVILGCFTDPGNQNIQITVLTENTETFSEERTVFCVAPYAALPMLPNQDCIPRYIGHAVYTGSVFHVFEVVTPSLKTILSKSPIGF
jgi:hypothetical protein